MTGAAPATDPLAPLRSASPAAAVLTDFDGTLAPIVRDPAAAAPNPRAVAALHHLAQRYAVVGVVSGRPVEVLRRHLGDGLWLAGVYGLETWDGHRLVVAGEAEGWRPAVAAAVEAARAVFGPLAEDKGLSLTVHFRTAPAREGEVRAWAAAEAARSGLEVREAKASIELHPHVGLDKGTTVEGAAAGLAAACYLGDDVGDLPAFDALDRLAERGVATTRVAVRTSETPDELVARADLVVDGTDGVAEVLESLVV